LKDAERELLAVCSEVKQLQSKDDKVTMQSAVIILCLPNWTGETGDVVDLIPASSTVRR